MAQAKSSRSWGSVYRFKELLMVYQMPCPGKDGVLKESVFVASSYQSQAQAQRELERWAAGNGYLLAEAPRTFTVYGHEQQPRQWMLLKRGKKVKS
jgi:hypothetical protein